MRKGLVLSTASPTEEIQVAGGLREGLNPQPQFGVVSPSWCGVSFKMMRNSPLPALSWERPGEGLGSVAGLVKNRTHSGSGAD